MNFAGVDEAYSVCAGEDCWFGGDEVAVEDVKDVLWCEGFPSF